MGSRSSGSSATAAIGRQVAFLSFFFCVIAVPVGAAGVVSGLVLDGRTGQPLRGANLQFDGAEAMGVTDLNGVFTVQVGAGSWSVVVSMEGYETQRVLDVTVADGDVANFSVVLNPKEQAATRTASSAVSGPENEQRAADEGQTTVAEEITVTAEAIAATEAALLAERKGAAQILDNIGEEEFSKNSAADAAGALKRVTGISLQDNKYVFVRGLGERYSNTTLNGSRIPTTEFERKVVPLDLFPSDLLEKITVSKSYTVDQPGDFAAGVVELVTKQFPNRQTLKVSASAGHNSVTTGERILRYGGGLSFSGGGGQGLPAGFPSETVKRFDFFTGEGFSNEELEQIGDSLVGLWTPTADDSAPLDQGFDATYGNSYGRLGVVLSGTWGRSRQVRQEGRNFYSTSRGNVNLRDFFDVDYGDEKVKQSLMGNLALRLSDNSQLRLRSLFTDHAVTESRIQTGFYDDLERNIRDNRLLYRAQEVESLQLSADHFFSGVGPGGSLLEWRVADSTAKTDENHRETVYVERNDVFQLSSQGQSGFIFINDLVDDLGDFRADWSTYFGGSKTFGTFKSGVALRSNDRDFDGRRFRFQGQRLGGIDLTAPAEEIFSSDNIAPGVLEISEVTNKTDNYQGTHDVRAVYTQGDVTFGKWRLIAGVRYEDSDIEVVTFDRANPDRPAVTAVEDQDVLPSISAVYGLTSRMSFRGTLSRTVNRPEYREIAPFFFTHLVGGFGTFGNPDLLSATVDSFDVRFDRFPSAREVIAVSLFVKEFDQPIEQVAIPGATVVQSYQNADGATNRGFEIEVRKNFGFLHDSLEPLTAILNYTYVDSQIDLDPNRTSFTNIKRPLTGQPDNLANLVLEWAPEKWPATTRLLFNYIDDVIFLGGEQGLPDILEDSHMSLDLVYLQELGRRFSLKLDASNLTNEDRVWSQGGEVWRSYEPGREFGLSFGLTLQ